MTASPHHPGDAAPSLGYESLGGLALDTATALAWLGLAALYLLAGRAAALRGREDWPPQRTLAWLAGTGFGLAVTAGPLAHAAAASAVVHTAVHLVLGMLAPLLLVLGAPASLFLRAVPVDVGRRFSRIVQAQPMRALTHPVVATLLSTVPMALLYWDGTALTLLHDALLGPLLHLHFLVSGTLFAYAVVGLDPNPHRAGALLRCSMIVLSIAVHGVVAKHLYAVATSGALPPGTEQAAQLMYYGGDAVHVLLLVVFCSQVYRRAGSRGSTAPRFGSA